MTPWTHERLVFSIALTFARLHKDPAHPGWSSWPRSSSRAHLLRWAKTLIHTIDFILPLAGGRVRPTVWACPICGAAFTIDLALSSPPQTTR